MAELIAYVRTPSGDDEDLAALAEQRAAIGRWAKRRRHSLIAIIEEDSEANDLAARDGLADVLATLHQGPARGLVVYRLDCLHHDLVTQEQLLAEVRTAGARVYSLRREEALELRRVAADPTRQIVREALRTAAASERQMAALRSRRHRHARASVGSPPFGYRVQDGGLTPEPAEQAALARIIELRASGASLREIARDLERSGHQPKRGDRWHPETVRRIVERFERVRNETPDRPGASFDGEP
jgi:DNA invertase Pin-like site-specific DNA recombinase